MTMMMMINSLLLGVKKKDKTMQLSLINCPPQMKTENNILYIIEKRFI